MKFRVERTSDYRGVNKPCEKAELVACKEHYGGLEYRKYELEITTLQELLELVRECKNPVIVDIAPDGKRCGLEIYDDYRE